jgi:hypothetical protein
MVELLHVAFIFLFSMCVYIYHLFFYRTMTKHTSRLFYQKGEWSSVASDDMCPLPVPEVPWRNKWSKWSSDDSEPCLNPLSEESRLVTNPVLAMSLILSYCLCSQSNRHNATVETDTPKQHTPVSSLCFLFFLCSPQVWLIPNSKSSGPDFRVLKSYFHIVGMMRW